MGLAELLLQPILELIKSFGSGVLPTGGPSDVLRLASNTIDAAHQAGRGGTAHLENSWTGGASDAAQTKHTAVQKSAIEISDRGNEVALVMQAASADINAGIKKIEAIAQAFVARVTAAGVSLFNPAGLALLLGWAQEYLAQAMAVVAETRAKLDAHTLAMTQLGPPPNQVPAPVTPSTTTKTDGSTTTASSATTALSGMEDVFKTAGSGLTTVMSGAESVVGGALGTSGAGTSALGTQTTGNNPQSATQNGVQLQLPDGSTVTAPNEKAANAVRAALSQRGVPYVWGGTSPGVGLDCSGLTKYAYGQSGVELPRLAQEQHIGHPRVAASDLKPGDLAVWDGHVAMVIGNGQLVEAGDPVQTGPIRTENSGMNFYGFYRPTDGETGA